MGVNMIKTIKTLMILIVFILTINIISAETSVSQYGITWTFSSDKTVGQFANGDYWVIGPVTIENIAPNFNEQNNGWQVNPVPQRSQGFDAGAWQSTSSCNGCFNASLVPNLPYTASPGESIVKAKSKFSGSSDCYGCCLQTAVVLTVVGEAPPGNGADVFRPPYVGDDKPYYRVSDLRTDLLPSHEPVGSPGGLDWIYDRYKYVQLDHGQGRTGRIIRPEDNMANYQPNNAATLNEAILRLLLNDPINEKMPGLIAVVQGGIDKYHIVLNGQDWPAGGGYEPGHKIHIAFAAALLNHQGMKNTAREDLYLEDRAVYTSSQSGCGAPGKVLFGVPQNTGSDKTRRDPYEYIDGGYDPGGNYQNCCLSQPWKGNTLITYMMPAMQDLFSGDSDWDEILIYSTRWVEHGTWTLPDPYNRFPDTKHGSNTDGGFRRSNLADAMWSTYRYSTLESCTSQGFYCCPSGYSCSDPKSGTGCGAGETCCSSDSAPVCTQAQSCDDLCSQSGLRECTDSTHFWTCGNYDSDSCLEWSSSQACGAGQTCSNGECTGGSGQTCSEMAGSGSDCCTGGETCGGTSYSGSTDCTGTCCSEACQTQQEQCLTSSLAWQNIAIETQTETFSVEFEATPNQANMDGVIALASSPGFVFSDYAVLIRFYTDGNIDAKNGGTYSSDSTITYSSGTRYYFRVVVNVPSHTYSVYVTPQGESEQTLASNYAFRTEQNDITEINYWGIIAEIGSHEVCLSLSQSACGASDDNSDGVVSISELIDYIGKWKTGNVTISELMDAIGLWKNGC